jgi:riboflavin synthase
VFTGLVQSLGDVERLDRSADGVRIRVRTELGSELSEGDSIAVNGVCLTATDVAADAFAADVVNETLARSSLSELAEGRAVNLELPLRAADRLGGHFVQGHVDGVGSVVGVTPDGFGARVRIAAPPALMRYIVQKGSITVDGISLTVAALDAESFTVALIPETLERTTLGRARAGTVVNLEVDVLAKYVEKLITVERQP